MPEEHVTGIERELAALLALEPSCGFAAGVRARVVPARPSHAVAAWAVAAAALFLVGASAAVLRVTSQEEKPAVARPFSRAPHTDVVLRLNIPVAPARPRSHGTAPVDRRRAADVQLLIDPAFSMAVQRLLREAQRPPEVNALVPPEEAPAADLAITPMVVEELSVPVIKVVETRSLSK